MQKNLKLLADHMRKNPTKHEKLLWYALKDKLPQYHFRRQYIIGKYIVDFVNLKTKLILECDGGQHSAEKDKERDLFLKNKGYNVLHIWNFELSSDLDVILNLIYNHIENNET